MFLRELVPLEIEESRYMTIKPPRRTPKSGDQGQAKNSNATSRMEIPLRPGGLLTRTVLLLLALACVPTRPALGVIRDGGIDPANLGQGGWLYLMNNATNHLSPNYVAAVTNENSLFLYLKNQGLNYVIIKAGLTNLSARTTNYWDSTYSTTWPVFNSNLVNIAHANGLKVFGSHRSADVDIPGELWIVTNVFSQGADGYVWDAEAQWERSDHSNTNLAWTLASTVRSNWPNKLLVLNCADTLYLHPIPYQQFAYWADCIMPMVYHHSASQGNAIMAIHWTDVNFSTWAKSITNTSWVTGGQTYYWSNAIKPIVPMRDLYGVYSGQGSSISSPQDLMSFIDYSLADPNSVIPGGYQGTDYFRSELHDTNQYATLKAATVGSFPGVVPSIVMDDARASVSGSWTMVKTMDAGTGSTVTFYGSGGQRTNSFGTNFFCRLLSTSGAYMQFTPNILTSGDYNVFQWHPTTNSASTAVPFVINYNGGSTTVYADQTTNGGNWSLLGRFNFAAGTAGYIRVTDSRTDSGKVALVDGVKLVYANTSVTLSSSANPFVYGDSLTLTAIVNVNAGGPPAGTVTFKDGSTTIGTATLDPYGQATFTTNKLSVSGSPHSLTAIYGGDASFAGSTSAALSQAVTRKALTITGLTAQDKVYDASTTAAITGTPAPSGVVSGDVVSITGTPSGQFLDPNVGNSKTVNVTGLSPSGADSGNYTLAPLALSANITAAATTTVLNSSPNPSGPGTNVTFTATVSSGAGTPSGNVVFSANGTPFATNGLVSGAASTTTASLPLGISAMTAQYLGGGNFLGSTGSTSQEVKISFACSLTNALLDVSDNHNGTLTLTFAGTPQAQYYVLASQNISAPMTSWVPVAGSTNTVTNLSGLWQYTVTNTAAQQFYRSTALTPCP